MMLNVVGIAVVAWGSMTGATIDSQKHIDQHYYAIASKATLLKPDALPVPASKFRDAFGEDWQSVLADGRAKNALDACEHLGIDEEALGQLWDSRRDKVVKLGGGFYCAPVEVDGKPPIYTFNAFFMSMRSKFTAADAAVHYYVVRFQPTKLSWAQFRGEVLGPTDPAKAPPNSLRGTLLAEWQALGLAAAPNGSDNGVHASASPFEGLAERMNWLRCEPGDDDFGKALIDAGISSETIKAWSVDPQVVLPDGSKGSLFDALEDLNAAECLAKAIAISKAALSA